MAVGSNAAKDGYLDATLGTGQAAWIPDPLYLALYDGDPRTTGNEMTGGGYAQVAVAASVWKDAASGQKQNGSVVSFAESTGAWSGGTPATWVALVDGTGNLYDVTLLDTPVTVSDTGATVRFPVDALTISYVG